MEYVDLSWARTEKAVDELCSWCLPREPAHILAVARGGLVPAVMLSHRLGIERVHVVQAISYGSKHQSRPVRIVDPLPQGLDDSRLLIVDDIYDTGQTMARLLDEYLWAIPLCLVTKHPMKMMAPIHVEPGTWVRFPWEPQI